MLGGKSKPKSEKPDADEILDGKTALCPGLVQGSSMLVVICSFCLNALRCMKSRVCNDYSRERAQ